MLDRRQFLQDIVLRASVLGTLAAIALPGNRTARAVPVGDLREQLRVELEPRTPAENAFLDRTVWLVRRNVLPLALVLRMFDWAREIRPYPFPYFQRALTIQARKIGVKI
jgi:hypothetical protein